MTRNRKQGSSTKKPKSSSSSPQAPLVDIPEAEQWRIIKDSGILNAVRDPAESSKAKEEEEEPIFSPLAEEVFSAIALIIPHSFLLLMMDILVHYQYGRKPLYGVLAERMITSVPILSIFVFYTARYKARRAMQALLFALALGVGSRLVWIINNAPMRTNIIQAPPLATVWVYTVVQLDLLPATVSLIVVFCWVKYMKLKIFF
ncbi:hypothetical protein ABKN59_000170 [Abortiporus biennis]